MRSAEQVDGFPPKEVVKTVFVEHDIQGDLGELNLVDYVQVIIDSPVLQHTCLIRSLPGTFSTLLTCTAPKT